jgi:hypothetical protein
MNSKGTDVADGHDKIDKLDDDGIGFLKILH